MLYLSLANNGVAHFDPFRCIQSPDGQSIQTDIIANNTSNVSSASNKQETATDSPPTYNEAMEERQSQDSTKPNETTALNSGDKVGYTPGSSAV